MCYYRRLDAHVACRAVLSSDSAIARAAKAVIPSALNYPVGGGTDDSIRMDKPKVDSHKHVTRTSGLLGKWIKDGKSEARVGQLEEESTVTEGDQEHAGC
jgi:hypothetical protein